MSVQPLAEQLFDAMSRESSIRCDVEDALLEAAEVDPHDPKGWPLQDFSFDDYDFSFEFEKVRVGWKPPEGAIAKWRALGFRCCWLNYVDGSELSIGLDSGRSTYREVGLRAMQRQIHERESA